ncbi:MAG: hypothetical protein CL537_10890 [Alcanivoracaceae bacterium]|nr:hypothetical protein [Alcanivoracaceae bacterium]|tara:strand:+ start:1940 stop:2665 length:726 start_codon:yes stop_codon:yes gene_type:complete
MDGDEDILEIMREIILDKESPLKKVDASNLEVPIANAMEGYILACSQSLSVVSTSIDKARLSIEVLGASYKSLPDETQVTADEFIEFAIENYFIRSSAIYDRCLIFVNRLLDLGIANESIVHELIVTNDHVKKYGLNEKLKAIRKKCTEYRVQRNKIVHHGRYSEEVFNGISAMHKINSWQKVSGEKPSFSDEIVDKMTHEFIDIQLDEFSAHLESIEAKVHELYELSLPIYQTKKNDLRQ